MIESIDDKLKVLLAEKAIDAAAQEQASIHSKVDIPVYREYANYAFEAGEIESYKASRDANIACRDAIEAAITENFSDNRLASEIAVTSVLEQFSAERVAYVLANTIPVSYTHLDVYKRQFLSTMKGGNTKPPVISETEVSEHE